MNEISKTTKLILKNSPANFVIGNPLLSYPVKIVQSNYDVPEQDEWEKECESFLKEVYSCSDFIIYENITYGGFLITNRTYDLHIIALTYQNYYDLNQSITRTTFTVNNKTYVFDEYLGLLQRIWGFDKEEF